MEDLYQRYNVLEQNLNIYLLQFMYEDTDQEFEEKNNYRVYLGYNRRPNKDIYLKINTYQLSKIINFMFNPNPDYFLFKSSDYNKTVNGSKLLAKKRAQINDPKYDLVLNLETLLEIIKLNIDKFDTSNHIYTINDYEEILAKEKTPTKKLKKN